ncbi:protein EMBRYO DEFECTIVE 514 [Ricinus communis]|uniref:EMB514 n=1 Tax=Ricinus communis TaxID=3988 RepID=B9RLY4_RICCO|nr:protein EMBRYO DEFECTIVE 514 [Ricinus communis]EEF47859.1 conserved hypothetical protein [Ricinus communis]|eukprot:XP_002514753.1 protein EMBRYO DEFECTIVE 514 [Ricinus communis]
MAEEKATEPTQANQERVDSTTEDMDVAEESAANGAKRVRDSEEEQNDDDVSKKQKVDKSVEEERLEKLEEGEGEEDKEESVPVSLGPKSFGSSVEMFDYFYNLLHYWPPNLTVNKYEHMVLLELLKKGHSDPEKKIGGGIQAFQVRYHPMWKSRCFFLIRDDDTMDDFSFRKCVDKILPLPEDMKIKSDGNGKGHGGKGGGGSGRGGRGRGRGRGHGRGGKSRG